MKLGTIDISAIKLGSTDISKTYLGSSVVYESGPDYTEPFYVEDISGSSNTLSIVKLGSKAPTLNIQKSTDGTTWTSMGSTSTTSSLTATVPANGKLYLRCNTDSWGTGSTGNKISCSKIFNVGGNTMSLLYGSNFTGQETTLPSTTSGVFYKLFYSNTSTLKNSKDLLLPSTTLYDYSYNSMFYECNVMETSPKLPATTVGASCYGSMFYNCKALTSAPNLPATTLNTFCYYMMFYGCSALTTVPSILPATTLVINCYDRMFINCTSLRTGPELPATTLVKNCYQYLFYGCTSLNYIKVHFTTWPNFSQSSASDYQATNIWTQLTKNTTGTFVCPSSLPQNFNASGNNSTGSTISGKTNAIPYGWSVETF